MDDIHGGQHDLAKELDGVLHMVEGVVELLRGMTRGVASLLDVGGG